MKEVGIITAKSLCPVLSIILHDAMLILYESSCAYIFKLMCHFPKNLASSNILRCTAEATLVRIPAHISWEGARTP